MRSRMMHAKGIEMIWEVYTRTDTQMVKELFALEHVESVNLLEHDGTLRV